MKIARVQEVEWLMEDDVYSWYTRPGSVEVGPTACWEWHPVVKQELAAFRYVCEQKQPRTFIDIGAHCGIFSSVYCTLVQNHQCYAIEPIKAHIDRIANTAAVNKWNLSTHSVGLNNYVGVSYYHNSHMAMFVDNPEYVVSAEHINNNPENAIVSSVNITTLDEFVKTQNIKPDLIKIDTEGYEVPILEKAQYTLLNHNVDLFLEAHRDECLKLGWDVRKLCDYIPKDTYTYYTPDLLYTIEDLEDYITNYESNTRFIALHKNSTH